MNYKLTKKITFTLVLLVILLVNILGHQNAAADEVPAFFLKIAKTLPRLGRSENSKPDAKDDYSWYKGGISKRKVGFPPGICS